MIAPQARSSKRSARRRGFLAALCGKPGDDRKIGNSRPQAAGTVPTTLAAVEQTSVTAARTVAIAAASLV